MNGRIPIIIPAYEPDERLIALAQDLAESGEMIIIVDDGSGLEYAPIFEKCKAVLGEKGILLTHPVNRGKGRALKTAFLFVLEHCPDAAGAVTADSDGQHSKAAIDSVGEALRVNPGCLVLGVRSFVGEGIPWKSMFGNKLTVKVLSYVVGIQVSDTQTGLRGIPRDFMKRLVEVKGERFEFETEMLIESAGHYPIMELPIETIYDSEKNHQTHFDPIADSIRIYRIFGRMFLKYIFSSVSACVLDLLCFSVFCFFLKTETSLHYIFASTVLARIVSAVYNYIINYKVVFHSGETVGKSAVKYFMLAAIQMGLSALGVMVGVSILPMISEVVIKMMVDTVLFFVSYCMQRKYVF